LDSLYNPKDIYVICEQLNQVEEDTYEKDRNTNV